MQKIWHGIFWKVFSCGCFAGTNVLVRYLSGGSPIPLGRPLPIYTIMFFQNLIGMICIFVWVTSSGEKKQLRFPTTHIWLHVWRILTAAIGIGLWYLSLRYIPVTQVVAISFIAPVITILGAVLVLRENFNLQRKIAVTLSLIGGFLIARPDQALFNSPIYSWYLILPLCAALIFSLDKIFTRKLLNLNETPKLLAWYLLAFIAPVCLIPAAIYGWVTPNLEHLPWLLVLGGLGALAHYSFNRAYELAEVTVLLPFGAAKLLICSAISYATFYEIPKTLDLWMGIIVITLSTIVLSDSFLNWVKRLIPKKMAGELV